MVAGQSIPRVALATTESAAASDVRSYAAPKWPE